jgi:hypothetical protein
MSGPLGPNHIQVTSLQKFNIILRSVSGEIQSVCYLISLIFIFLNDTLLP